MQVTQTREGKEHCSFRENLMCTNKTFVVKLFVIVYIVISDRTADAGEPVYNFISEQDITSLSYTTLTSQHSKNNGNIGVRDIYGLFLLA